MTHVEADAIAALWEDLLQGLPLPPRVAGVTAAEYELAGLVQADPVLISDTPEAETWVWSDLHLRDAGAFEATGRPFADLGAMEAAILAAWHTLVGPTDTVVCLGDVAYPSAFDDEALVEQLRDSRGTGSSSSATTTWRCGVSSRRPVSASRARPCSAPPRQRPR